MKRLNVITSFAELSDDGVYRYKLGRVFDWPGKTALWIGVNPSTADAEIDDQSIRKLYGFAEKLQFRRWLVGNLFAYRATDVTELAKAADPIGRANDAYLAEMVDEADVVVAGWGRIDKIPLRLRDRVDQVANMIMSRGRKLCCWGTCQDGSPRHPLMIPYSTRLEPWL